MYIYMEKTMWKTLSDENLFAEKTDKCDICMRSFVINQRRIGPFNHRVRIDKSSVPIRYSVLM